MGALRTAVAPLHALHHRVLHPDPATLLGLLVPQPQPSTCLELSAYSGPVRSRLALCIDKDKAKAKSACDQIACKLVGFETALHGDSGGYGFLEPNVRGER